jgi:hypothetical protein
MMILSLVYGDGNSYIKSDTGEEIYVPSNFDLNDVTTTITIVYDTNQQKAFYYQDGILKHTATLPPSSTKYNFGKLNIFAGWDGESRIKKGIIYNVRIYDKALSELEVLQNYLAGLSS